MNRGGEAAGQRRAADRDHRQRRPGLRRRHLQQPLQHHRYGEERVAPVRHERGQRGGRVEAAVQHDGGAQRQATWSAANPQVWKIGAAISTRVAGVQRDPVDDGHQRAEAGRGAAGGRPWACRWCRRSARWSGRRCSGGASGRRAARRRSAPGEPRSSTRCTSAGTPRTRSANSVVVHQQPAGVAPRRRWRAGAADSPVLTSTASAPSRVAATMRLDQPVVVAAQHADPVARPVRRARPRIDLASRSARSSSSR